MGEERRLRGPASESMDDEDGGCGEEVSVLVSVVDTSKLLDPIASSKRIKVAVATWSAYLVPGSLRSFSLSHKSMT